MSDYRDITTLRNWDKNPRSSTDESIERLIKQIKKLGVYKPLLITEDGTVLGGNMRLKALQKMGEKKVWVSIVDAPTEEKKIEYALSDNDRVGKYESDQLEKLIGDFPEVSWSDYSVDIKEPELVTDLMDSFKEVVEDEVPEVSMEPAVSKLGEIYQLGRHRVMCGDSTKIEDVTRLMDGKKADMVFTDPPYGVDYDGGHKEWKVIENDGNQEFEQTINDAFANLVVVTKLDAGWYIWHASNTSDEFYKAVKNIGKKPSAQIVWVKNNMAGGFGDYRGKHEPCIYIHGQFYGGRDQHTVWEVNKEIDYKHPTQKPVELGIRALNNSSKQEDIIIDAFLGSGSTLIACEQTNRICYGMELDPKYCDVIRKRYAKFIGKEDNWIKVTKVVTDKKQTKNDKS